MGSQNRRMMLVGSCFWLVFVCGGFILLVMLGGATGKQAGSVARLIQYGLGREEVIPIQMSSDPRSPGTFAEGDPVFVRGEDGEWIDVGFVKHVSFGPMSTTGSIVWHQSQFDPSMYSLHFYESRGNLRELWEMLVPASKRRAVEQLIRSTMEAHAAEITSALQPIVTGAMQESLPAVEMGLRESFVRHRSELEEVGKRYEETLLREQLLPLLREEVLPVVRFHGEPLAREIGLQLWDRASIWRFGWRALYDRTPLPQRDLLRREWDRFVDEEAVPVLEGHVPDMLEVQKRIVIDVLRNSAVRDELGAMAEQILADPQLQALVMKMLREAVVENSKLHQVWMDHWKSPAAQAAFELTGERLEPMIRRIGEEILGTPEGGIEPGLARVLRNQILQKDKSWLVAIREPQESQKNRSGQLLQQAAQGVPRAVARGADWQPYPLTIIAGEN